MNLISPILLVIIFLYCADSLNSQCREDLFGSWEDMNQEMSIITPEFSGKSNSPLSCTLKVKRADLEVNASFYKSGKRQVTISFFSYNINADSSDSSYDRYHLEFFVERSTSQMLTLTPKNEEAITLLGSNRIELYNLDYIRWDDIELNNLYFSMFNGRYSIDLQDGMIYKKSWPSSNRKEKHRYYIHQLDLSFLESLKANILRSNIIYISVCDRKWKSASDTYSKFIAIDFNGRVINYTTYYLYDSVYPLYYDMIEISRNLKWKRIKDIELAEEKFKYFYHYGSK